jgi:hypothetical protein
VLSFHSLHPVNVACPFEGGQTSLHCADTDATSLCQGVLRWAAEATLRVHEVVQQVSDMVTGSGDTVIATHGSDPGVAIGWLTLSAEVVVRGGFPGISQRSGHSIPHKSTARSVQCCVGCCWRTPW